MSAFSWRYYCYITPVVGYRVYGTEIDVSDKIDFSGIGKIKKSIDSTNFQFGIFNFGDITITAQNRNGYFNEASDSRSIFTNTRDLSKVRFVFQKGYTDSIGDWTTTDTIMAKGLIQDESTRIDADNETIQFRVMSYDSCFNKTKVSASTVADGDTVANAIFSILDTPDITRFLTVDIANIVPMNDIAIDDGGYFDDKKVKDAIEQLLAVSNSVLTVNSSLAVIVSSRNETANTPLYLYGKSNINTKENIVSLNQFNNGRHRMFNYIVVNETIVSENSPYQLEFGARRKEFTFNFMTETATLTDIADTLLDTFEVPKMECRVTVPTRVTLGFDLLDRVSIDYPLRLKPEDGTFLPLLGTTILGETSEPLPYQYGSLQIDAGIKWKIIEMVHDPKAFTTELLLRQCGTTLSDGIF